MNELSYLRKENELLKSIVHTMVEGVQTIKNSKSVNLTELKNKCGDDDTYLSLVNKLPQDTKLHLLIPAINQIVLDPKGKEICAFTEIAGYDDEKGGNVLHYIMKFNFMKLSALEELNQLQEKYDELKKSKPSQKTIDLQDSKGVYPLAVEDMGLEDDDE